MFFKQLYQYNKKMFVLLCIYLLVFIVINIKWGVIAIPVSQFGMYAGTYKLTDTVEIYHVYADSTKVDFAKLSLTERDILELSIKIYLLQRQSNAAVLATMKRLFSKIGIARLIKEDTYTNHITPEQFTAWYKRQLSLAGYKNIVTAKAYSQKYIWHDKKLRPLAEPVKLNCLDAE